MKRLLWTALAGLLAAFLVLLAWMHWPVRLDVRPLPADLRLPPATPPAAMTLWVVDTAAMHSTAGLAYRGGNLLESREFTMSAYLVRHPRGDLLIDAGLGRLAPDHLRMQPAVMQALSELEMRSPLGARLQEANYDPSQLTAVLLTHTHWDHVSGLADIPGVPVWVGETPAAEPDPVFASVADREVKALRFVERPYLGYPRSADVWGDGSVVVVPSPGHTADSVVVFVTLPGDRRYAFVGDTVWQLEGIERPAERPLVPQWLVDSDAARVREQIGHLAGLHERFPDLVMVPAHDGRATRHLPRLTSTP